MAMPLHMGIIAEKNVCYNDFVDALLASFTGNTLQLAHLLFAPYHLPCHARVDDDDHGGGCHFNTYWPAAEHFAGHYKKVRSKHMQETQTRG